MAEKCINAYRQRDKSVRCRAMSGNMNYCKQQILCPNTKRWEADSAAECDLKNKPADK